MMHEISARDHGARRWWLAAVALMLLGSLLRLPALQTPRLLDDHLQRAMYLGEYPAPRGPLDYYAFARSDPTDHARIMADGTFPWWTATNFRLVMVRPLSSALVWFDYRVLRHPSAMRAHSLFWLLAWWCAAGCLLRRRLGDLAGILALAILVLDDASIQGLGWTANRCAIVAVFFATLSVDRATRFIDDGRPREGALAFVAALLAVLSAEYSWTVLAAIPLYALVSRSRRIPVIATTALVALAYSALRVAAGAGAQECALYPDLSRGPWIVLGQFVQGIVPLLGDLLAGYSVDALSPWLGVVYGRGLPALLGVASVFVVTRRLRAMDASSATKLRWIVGSGVLAIAIVAPSWSSARLALGASLWSAAFVGIALAHARRDRVLALVAAVLVVGHGVQGASQTLRYSSFLRGVGVATDRSGAGLFPPSLVASLRADPSQSIYQLNAIDSHELPFGRFLLRTLGLPTPRGWYALASTATPVFVYREDANTLSIVHPTTILGGIGLRFFRDREAGPAVGYTVTQGEAHLEVVARAPSGITRLRVRFDRSLDDPTLWLMVSTPRGLERFRPPRPRGSLELPAPRLWGSPHL